MILLELFFGFLKVGLFSFGGAYSAIPLIREVVLSYGWLTEEALTNMIAVSESTPGPIMVNVATYVGASQAGLAGAALATLAVILPSFVVILLVVRMFRRLIDHPAVKAVMGGLIPTVVAIILATGLVMLCHHLFPRGRTGGLSGRDLILAAILIAAMALPKLWHKKLPPITGIVLGAVLGVVLYGI